MGGAEWGPVVVVTRALMPWLVHPPLLPHLPLHLILLLLLLRLQTPNQSSTQADYPCHERLYGGVLILTVAVAAVAAVTSMLAAAAVVAVAAAAAAAAALIVAAVAGAVGRPALVVRHWPRQQPLRHPGASLPKSKGSP